MNGEERQIRIMLVDDDEDAFVLTRDHLDEIPGNRYALTWAASFEEAIERIATGEFDAFLVDYLLGAQTGLDLVRWLKSVHIEEPVILLTGNGDLETDLQAMYSGVVDYLVKDDLSAAVLERAVRYAVQRRLDELERRKLEHQLVHWQKMEAIGQLAAGMAHEITTPLQYIGENVRFLEELVGAVQSSLSEGALKFERKDGPGRATKSSIDSLNETNWERKFTACKLAIGQTLEGVELIAKVVHGALQLAHPGMSDLHEVDINQIVENVLRVSRGRWRSVAEVTTDLEPALPLIIGNPVEVGQVILNLMNNAVDAIQDDPGRQPGLGRIVIRTEAREEGVCLEVSDSGPGIPEELRLRVFEPFFTTKEIGKGSGQGLAILYSILERHGGRIEVTNADGGGAVFTCWWPIRYREEGQ